MVDPEPASSEGYNAFEQHLEQPMTDTAHLSEWERLDPLMREAATAPHPLLVHSYAAVCMRDVMVDTTREARERVLTEAKQEVTRGSTVETCFRVGACICSLLELARLMHGAAAHPDCPFRGKPPLLFGYRLAIAVSPTHSSSCTIGLAAQP